MNNKQIQQTIQAHTGWLFVLTLIIIALMMWRIPSLEGLGGSNDGEWQEICLGEQEEIFSLLYEVKSDNQTFWKAVEPFNFSKEKGIETLEYKLRMNEFMKIIPGPDSKMEFFYKNVTVCNSDPITVFVKKVKE